MLSLHTNASSLSAQVSMGKTQSALSTSMTRLSTGYRINSAMDDAAGLQIATRLKAQTSGMAVAMRNAQNATSLMQTAEGSLSEVTNMLTRMKDLATQAADASSSTTDQDAMQAEFDALTGELGNLMSNTTFGGTNLFNTGSGALATAGLTFQIGASSSETMTVDTTTALGDLDAALVAASANYDGAAGGAVTTGTELTTNANGTIDLLSTAIDAVGTVRSQLGAASNSLEHIYNNLSNMSTNVTQAAGRITDVDYATETSNMTTQQMLMQAGTSMLKQSNSMSQMVLSLMQ